jgi:hypothetical protein
MCERSPLSVQEFDLKSRSGQRTLVPFPKQILVSELLREEFGDRMIENGFKMRSADGIGESMVSLKALRLCGIESLGELGRSEFAWNWALEREAGN